MANNYRGHKQVPGANKEEAELLKSLTGTEIILSTKISRHMYAKFVKGLDVPSFVRTKIMKFVQKKADKLERTAKRSKIE